MPIDRDRLVRIFDELGQKLENRATICVIGSAPGIMLWQPGRLSQDIDVWYPHSQFDETPFRRACQDLGVLYDPRTEIDPDAIYIQIVRPGIVNLPADFKIEVLGEYGSLKVAMPDAALLSAAKLVRGDPRDVEDVTWWMKERALRLDDIRAAIDVLPDSAQRETAGENLILVELVTASERTGK